MRADMGKVLVERPRLRGQYSPGPGKGYRKQVRKALDEGDAPPTREGMTRRYGHNRKVFNEHLSPLRRFLESNTGRRWDKVYAEICRHVDRGNVVQKHILTHLFDYVVTAVVLIDGEPCNGTPGYRYGDPLRTSHNRHQWYVCPKSGLLRRSRYVPRSEKKVKPPRVVRLNKRELCIELNGQWELVTVEAIPTQYTSQSFFDVVRKVRVFPGSFDQNGARAFYGEAVCAMSRRPLSRQELRALPIPIEWLR